MLGKVAKKLRIFGFDTEYLANTDDNEIINRFSDRKRIILTRDKQLYKRLTKLNIPSFPIISDNELETLIIIMRESNVNHVLSVPNENTRCSLCNGTLDKAQKSSLAADIVPKKVFENANIFFMCSNCNKIYWDGKHTKELNQIIDKINKEIKQI
jgi:uncharacterized protein with PIN domain